MATRFILIRHGETEWNRGAERFRGRADVPLNDVGIAQAQHVATRLASENISAIYASPAQRTLRSAQPLADAHHLTVQPHPGLLDLDFGALEGLTVAEARAAFPNVIACWSQTPGQAIFPQGEAFDTMRTRVITLLHELAEQRAEATIALVTHRTVCHAMLCVALGLPANAFWRVQVDNASISKFDTHGDGYLVKLMNETSHLQTTH